MLAYKQNKSLDMKLVNVDVIAATAEEMNGCFKETFYSLGDIRPQVRRYWWYEQKPYCGTSMQCSHGSTWELANLSLNK